MTKLTTMTITVNATTAKLLQRMTAQRPGRAKMQPGGWIITRGLAVRLGLTEGGTNGLLTRHGLQMSSRGGRYQLTDKAAQLGLGRQPDQDRLIEWRAKPLMEWLASQPYPGERR